MARACADGCCSRVAERHRPSLHFALMLLGYVLYLLLGAAVFSAIELPYEHELRRELLGAKRDFLREHVCVSDERLEELLGRALMASNYGVSVLRNDSRRNWDFVSSLFFSSTVLTTTGYGHTVPLSDEGKAFCIFYALCGIPVTLFLLSLLVKRIMSVVTQRPVAYFHRRWGVPAAAHATCLAVLMAVVLLFIPAGIFTSLERDWDFLESLYFCFISLSTIGLGDYVPGETHSNDDITHPQLYRLAITIYLLLGLVCVLVVLETCCELPQMKRLSLRFQQEHVRELDSETTNIIGSEQLGESVDRFAVQHSPVITSVSDQAASLRQDTAAPYIPAANGKLR
ncbi:potassium channel subfamily K member 1-like [Nelusetta ayraudi]|uniref:potassium channel subfamily K member 1-like n=1 Tax=Nelusetta ayraudi TaxID=303726 RepID=UPI003F71FDFC